MLVLVNVGQVKAEEGVRDVGRSEPLKSHNRSRVANGKRRKEGRGEEKCTPSWQRHAGVDENDR